MKTGARLGSASIIALLGVAAANACTSGGRTAGGAPGADAAAPATDAARALSSAYHKSGSRLRAEVVGQGDAWVFDRFYDTQRNETCTFVQTPSGEYRCLPSHVPVEYFDAACTDTSAIGVLDDCTKGVRYAVRREARTCGRPTSAAIFTLGDLVEKSTSYARSGAGCQRTGDLGRSEVHELGAEIPLAEFVRASAVRVDVGGDLAVERLVGDDGSELFVERYEDRARGSECSLLGLGVGETGPVVCLPSGTAMATARGAQWADPSCTQPAVSVDATGCGTPSNVALRVARADAGAATCVRPDEYETTVFDLGAPLATVYQGPSCTADHAPSGSHFALGAPRASSAFPSGELATLGTGRIRLKAVVRAGVQLHGGVLHDEEKHSYCRIMPVGTQLYCVTDDVAHVWPHGFKFKDANCTQPVYVANECERPTTLLRASVDCQGVAYEPDIHPLGEPFPLAVYYYEKGGTCSPVTNARGLAYDVLPAVPVSAHLAEVTRTRE